MAEDTPIIEDVSSEALEMALKAKSELDKDVKILTSKIDSSLSVIQEQLNILHDLRALLNKRVEVENG